MDIRTKLESLRIYFTTARGVGHTTLVKNGFDNYNSDKFILTTNMDRGHQFKCRTSEIVTLDSLHKLCACNRPMVVDNSVLIVLFSETLLELKKMDAKLYLANKELQELENQHGNTSKSTYGWPGGIQGRGSENRSYQME